jgi:hypothetical protein
MLRYESHESSLERAFWEATQVCANNGFPGIVDAPEAGTALCLEVSQAGMGLQRGPDMDSRRLARSRVLFLRAK